ncbi:hypothetical protein MTR_8g011260 [Medicago truncatula]|uniref:Uncharacterized protein n=1 Tax=Medicago truncatula TaxID=3880 RepID=G7LEA5_MEDTR|nr:hypothetical protein MTR_8g011260 [Medicago truncatula]
MSFFLLKNKETGFSVFEHVEIRHADFAVEMVDEIEESHIPKVRSTLRITLKKTIMQNLEINELDKNMIFDKTL